MSMALPLNDDVNSGSARQTLECLQFVEEWALRSQMQQVLIIEKVRREMSESFLELACPSPAFPFLPRNFSRASLLHHLYRLSPSLSPLFPSSSIVPHQCAVFSFSSTVCRRFPDKQKTLGSTPIIDAARSPSSSKRKSCTRRRMLSRCNNDAHRSFKFNIFLRLYNLRLAAPV